MNVVRGVAVFAAGNEINDCEVPRDLLVHVTYGMKHGAEV